MSVSGNDHGHCMFFMISNLLLPPSRSTIITQLFFWKGFPLFWNYSKQFSTVTCIDTPHLLGDDCLQDAGIIKIGILHSRIAARFHRNTALNSPKHYNVSFTACNSMLLSSACDVNGTRCLYQGYTYRTASKLLVPYLKAFLCYVRPVPKLVTTICRGAPLPTCPCLCRVYACTLYCKKSPLNTLNWSRCHPKWKIIEYKSVLLTAESSFHLSGGVEHVLD